MKRISNFVKNLFSGNKPAPEPEDTETLRMTFKERYHSFKLLLSANNRALEVMAAMEQALMGLFPFDMAFVRSHCTAAAVNVLQMIKNMERLAPGKYGGLSDRFAVIRERIDQVLEAEQPQLPEISVIDFADVDQGLRELTGGKMAGLCEIGKLMRLNIPDGFVITSHAYNRFMNESGIQTEINRLFQTADTADREQLYRLSAEARQFITRAWIPDDIADKIRRHWRRIEEKAGRKITAALRSSALGEDSGASSFAGQYHSELNVSYENVLEAYKSVVASKYTLQAITYRLTRGFRDEDIPMPVGCVVMVDAQAGGVTYSRNPVNREDDSVFINAAQGLPKAVVDGTAACDLFVVSRAEKMEIVRREIARKDRKFVCYPEEGICRMEISGEDAEKPALTDEQIRELAEYALILEDYYESPQDMEWAVDREGRIFILQCRPMQQLQKQGGQPVHDREADENLVACGGVTASPGMACGEVFLAAKTADALRFPEGAVLVVAQALPEWAALLSRASAVVSEQGGIAGHLANVAREFGIPALFGLEGVMEKLKNGDRITVDADSLGIYRGFRELPEGGRKESRNLMEGSPVFRILRRACRQIVPLNLLDPDSRSFAPENCQTLHDITRFIHEKSVYEMFSFGKEHHFPEKSAKQLVYKKTPMQWWILNLDDGFREDTDEKSVNLDNIVSVPMLAFWEGFAAVPWEGPPAADGKGLMSVMFQSTANTALTTGVKSAYAQHNYFMISKNYCSLSSRLGYHFSMMEAMVSERDSENYISFQFKGGAADEMRRERRIEFIQDILEDYGFRVRVKNDHLSSRMEGHERSFMENRIRILGYLSLHTRQLDMIMGNNARIRHFDQKIRNDIETMMKSSPYCLI
ncbi:MAG: PEP/pyruvate-binding domain-containing protein [Desulfobacterales bacterium]